MRNENLSQRMPQETRPRPGGSLGLKPRSGKDSGPFAGGCGFPRAPCGYWAEAKGPSHRGAVTVNNYEYFHLFPEPAIYDGGSQKIRARCECE